jgi:OPA family glycerol-3-phosphate transporter-like MFS transporter
MATAPGRDALERLRARTLGVLWVTYGSFYFCRANLGPARIPLGSDLAYGAVEFGFIAGTVKLGYGLGQLVNGQLTERFGARRILTVGMIGSAVATMLFAVAPRLSGAPVIGGLAASLATRVAAATSVFSLGLHPSPVLGLMLLLAFANGWFQAGGWPPLVKVAGRWFPLAMRGRTMGVLGTSYTIGSALAIAAVGALINWSGGGWRIAFFAPGLVLLVSYVHMSLRLREAPPREDESPGVALRRPEGEGHERLALRQSLAATLGNARIWVLAFGLFGVDAVRYGFLDWAPGHLAEVHGTGALTAALKTAVFPLAGAVGTLTSGWLTDRFFQSRRAPVCVLLLTGVGLLTLAYRVVVGWGAVPTVVCLALVGFCLYGAQILLVGTAAQDFARRGATAAAAGFVDFMGHVGAFTGDVVTGGALRRYGWAGAITWWACAALVAAALVATLWRARPREQHE